ncbi:MAG: dTMP kinase [Steroidobacteraceae bacterium]
MSRERGRFITIEGIEAVGKSTQVARASEWLTRLGVDHIVTREPGGTPLAESIRQLVLQPRTESLPPIAELLLMFSARAVHLTNLIEPALQAGRWVLCDRFTDATFAYQGAGRGIEAQAIGQLEALVQRGLQPDLTLLLDLPVTKGLSRAASRGGQQDRFESERVEFFERVRAGYLQRAAAAPRRFRVIDAGPAIETVSEHIAAALGELLARPGSGG